MPIDYGIDYKPEGTVTSYRTIFTGLFLLLFFSFLLCLLYSLILIFDLDQNRLGNFAKHFRMKYTWPKISENIDETETI